MSANEGTREAGSMAKSKSGDCGPLEVSGISLLLKAWEPWALLVQALPSRDWWTGAWMSKRGEWLLGLRSQVGAETWLSAVCSFRSGLFSIPCPQLMADHPPLGGWCPPILMTDLPPLGPWGPMSFFSRNTSWHTQKRVTSSLITLTPVKINLYSLHRIRKT